MHCFYSKYVYNIILDHLATFRNFRFFRYFSTFFTSQNSRSRLLDPDSPSRPPKSDSSLSLKRRKNTKLLLEIKNKLSRSIQKSFLYNICSNVFFSPMKQKVRTLFFSSFFNFSSFSWRQW